MIEPHAPALEMLWEAYDPGRALDLRFGFRDGQAAGRWVTDTVDGLWGIRVESCERIVMSSGNALAWITTPSGRMLAKWSVVPDRFPRLAEVARLISWLDARGLPVSAPVPTRDGRLQAEVDGVSIGLQRVVEGDLLDTTDAGQVRAAGALLARLQEALAAYPDAARLVADSPAPDAGSPAPDAGSPASDAGSPASDAGSLAPHAETFPSLVERVTGWLDSDTSHLPAASRERAASRDALRELVTAAPPDRLPGQLVHFDFRSANILVAGGEITALLDFEEARHEHPLVDLARSAVLLGTRFHDWGPVPHKVHAEFLAGYQSVRPLTPAETAWWDVLLLWQAMVWQAMSTTPSGDDPTGWGASVDEILAGRAAAAVPPSRT